MRILVVDDEPAIRESIAYALGTEGLDVVEAATGERGLELATSQPFDAVILDVMLGDMSGVDVCLRLRARSSVPILMLTARDSEADRVRGLELGADDYIVKPFSMAELASRLRAIERRRRIDAEEAHGSFEAGELEVDLIRHEARVAGDPVDLTPTEFRILALLASEDRTFTREEILRHAWQTTFVPDTRSCDVHVGNLRRKIGEKRVLTVRSVGYRLPRM